MAHFMLPPIETLPLPGSADAARRGCSCNGHSEEVPPDPIATRPLFGYRKERWYSYNLCCPLHGRSAIEFIEDPANSPEEEAIGI